ncbi:MAG: CubicO group peptidase (beta-lactamase class C family) [Paraglaciecola sp.]|jgi:CubicO group peptidase (beta-lactamase class C family)
MKSISLIFLLSIVSFNLLADTNTLDKSKTAAVDKIFSEWDKANTPGCGLGIIKDGEFIYSRGYGMANLEYDIPNNSQSVFRIGSTSKQFTAASIVLLIEKGKLSFDDTLDVFFPGFPDYAKQITVRHLLNHTSGMRDYLSIAYLKGLQDDDYYTDKDVLHWLTHQSELNFTPGDEFVYSNSGYWLLGQIVNQVAKMSMTEFAKQEIFKPLGMSQTHFHNDHSLIVKNRASGYMPRDENTFQISMTTLNMIGDGGVFTSIDDIKKWDDAYYQSNVLSRDFWKMMTKTGKLNNDEAIDYASGLIVSDYNGLQTVSHGGSFVGFRAEILRFPEHKFSVVIFTNRGDANPSGMALKVADVFLSDQYVAEAKSPSATNTAINDRVFRSEELVGNYELQSGMAIKISSLNDKVHAKESWNDEAYELIKDALNSYSIAGADDIKFTFTGFKEHATQKILIEQRGRTSQWQRKEEVDLSSIQVQDYVGTYYSSELDVTYEISMYEGTIKLQVNNGDPGKLYLANKDLLTYQGSLLQFSRKNDKINDFVMDAGRVKNLRFVKK